MTYSLCRSSSCCSWRDFGTLMRPTTQFAQRDAMMARHIL